MSKNKNWRTFFPAFGCSHLQGLHSESTRMEDLAIVLWLMPFLKQPGLKHTAKGLWDRSTDHQATTP